MRNDLIEMVKTEFSRENHINPEKLFVSQISYNTFMVENKKTHDITMVTLGK